MAKNFINPSTFSKTMTRQRIVALIIEDKKILLVKDPRVTFFSMPGGGVEKDESYLNTLQRELKEELGVDIIQAEPYFSFELFNDAYKVPQTDIVYKVIVKGAPKPSAEVTELGWFSKDAIQSKKIEVPKEFLQQCFPKLINDKLL